MNKIRSILQTYIIVALGICHVLLITRFAIDFLGTDYNHPLLLPIYNVSSILIKPFEGSFTATEVDGSILNYAAALSIVAFIFVTVFCLSIIRIIFNEDLTKKTSKLVNLIFISLEVLLLQRTVLELLNAQTSSYLSFLTAISTIFTTPISLLASITGELVIELQLALSMLLLGLVWFTVYKLVEGAVQAAERLKEEKPQQRKVVYRGREISTPAIVEPEKPAPEKWEPQKEIQPTQVPEAPQEVEEVQEIEDIEPEKPLILDPTQIPQEPQISSEAPLQETKVKFVEEPEPKKKKEIPFLEKLKEIKKSIDEKIISDSEPETTSPFEKKGTSKKGDDTQKSPLG
ncbi:hypothetical protein JW766_06185 [Candidatus Dojkabacteria bacterium]|nr:hypothetical protein [Candidatus Dojkabacteria bacterium]